MDPEKPVINILKEKEQIIQVKYKKKVLGK